MSLFGNSFFLSLFSGLLLWLSFPGGCGFWPLLFVALVPLLQVLRGESSKRACFYGLLCGLLHFTVLLYWIVIVLGRYGGLAWFISLPALLLLALYMASYLALFGMVANLILRVFPAAVALWLLPSLWVGIDWLRGVLFTGFPWMDLGYALYKVPLLIQVADLAGHHGVSFLIVFVNCSLLLFFGRKNSIRSRLLILIPTLCLLGAAAIYSSIRFTQENEVLSADDTTKIEVGIVQGNIDQGLKWSPDQQQRTVENYLLRTKSLFASGHPSLVVWPETALPFYPPANGTFMQPLERLVATDNFALLTGAPWYEIVDRSAKKINFFNSALLLQPDGSLGGKYYKTHLVPFGEYVPLKKFLPFLAPLVEAVGDFRSGSIEQPLLWQQAKLGVLICFESVFPDLSRQWVLAGANVLVNLTNDAWYGRSSAPRQSLAMAVLRAVETRRSLIRSANTGISGFVNPAGTMSKESGLFVPWAETEEVVLSNELTVWARYGYLFAPICLIVGLIGGLAAIGKSRRAGETRR